jgi:hypothetical protein
LAAGCLHTRAPGAPCATPAYGTASPYPSMGPGQAASARGSTAGTRANALRTPSPDRAACRPALAPPADGACVPHHLAPPRSRPPPRKPLPTPLPRPPRQARTLPLKTRAVAVGSIFFPSADVRPPCTAASKRSRPSSPRCRSASAHTLPPVSPHVPPSPPRHGCGGRYRAVPVQPPGEAASGPTFANNRSRVSPRSFLASSPVHPGDALAGFWISPPAGAPGDYITSPPFFPGRFL